MKKSLESLLTKILKEIREIENSEQYINGWHDACNDLTYLLGKRDALFQIFESLEEKKKGGAG